MNKKWGRSKSPEEFAALMELGSLSCSTECLEGDFVKWFSCPSCSWAVDAPRNEQQQKRKEKKKKKVRAEKKKQRPIQEILRRGNQGDGNKKLFYGRAWKKAKPLRSGKSSLRTPLMMLVLAGLSSLGDERRGTTRCRSLQLQPPGASLW